MTTLFFSEYEETEPGVPLVIFGAGGLGREVLLLIQQLNAVHPSWDVRGFYDDQAPATPTVAGLPYLGSSADLNATSEPLAVAVAVGSPVGRAAVVSRLTSSQLSFPVLVHPAVALGSQQRITLGQGSIVQQGCLLTCDITLGRFVLLNLGCTVGHDAVLEDFASLMPHANVSGGAHLGAGCYLGTNATVIQGVRIGENTILGAGAVAVRDLPANITAVGVPAKSIKKVNA
ncbi:acetyltransferase [Hymenobacter arizonensis]|uniref:Sugar O-acyltransferase, sialic acid O-acetyltransferase NeuD family n=1 Tax=Hymenobacter arizonensis TaxID=1227077 RepID=A0A1I5ZWV2_HYMAR|nr:acetyltransferase [Hymenobacter arizonensis]SFQ60946.1 sugar O-acyltransferase, sialic acid O-acetyltransferase NeuD family [Hymenobacter arizonensis]